MDSSPFPSSSSPIHDTSHASHDSFLRLQSRHTNNNNLFDESLLDFNDDDVDAVGGLSRAGTEYGDSAVSMAKGKGRERIGEIEVA